MNKKIAVIFGGHGFICHHIARHLKENNWYVRTVDIAEYQYGDIDFCDEYVIGDLRVPEIVSHNLKPIDGKCVDLLIQGAANMGGMEFLASGQYDADVMHNSGIINYNSAYYAALHKVGKVFYCSSACIYPQNLQEHTNHEGLRETDAIPANCDLCYGWEKLYSEILYDAFRRNYNLDIAIARFHNVYGIEGTWDGIRAKAPAALCRKVAMAKDGDEIEVLGSGEYTRSFLDVSECVEGVMKIIHSGYQYPLNLGSDFSISINDLANMVIKISGKNLTIKNIESTSLGVVGRNSNNELIESVIGWKPSKKLEDGMRNLYDWVNSQVNPK